MNNPKNQLCGEKKPWWKKERLISELWREFLIRYENASVQFCSAQSPLLTARYPPNEATAAWPCPSMVDLSPIASIRPSRRTKGTSIGLLEIPQGRRTTGLVQCYFDTFLLLPLLTKTGKSDAVICSIHNRSFHHSKRYPSKPRGSSIVVYDLCYNQEYHTRYIGMYIVINRFIEPSMYPVSS